MNRTEEALELEPDVISTACPFCITMLSDAVNTKKEKGEAAEHVEVLDVSQILLRAMAPVGAAAAGAQSGPTPGSDGPTDRGTAPQGTEHGEVQDGQSGPGAAPTE
jgi:hypothetical protein